MKRGKKQISTALKESSALIHKSSKKQTADIPGKCREMVRAVDAMFRKVEDVAFHWGRLEEIVKTQRRQQTSEGGSETASVCQPPCTCFPPSFSHSSLWSLGSDVCLRIHLTPFRCEGWIRVLCVCECFWWVSVLAHVWAVSLARSSSSACACVCVFTFLWGTLFPWSDWELS